MDLSLEMLRYQWAQRVAREFDRTIMAGWCCADAIQFRDSRSCGRHPGPTDREIAAALGIDGLLTGFSDIAIEDVPKVVIG